MNTKIKLEMHEKCNFVNSAASVAMNRERRRVSHVFYIEANIINKASQRKES